jgi:sugar O-acyltransferase (sialic acid O-acetyltransferase NeuD family)
VSIQKLIVVSYDPDVCALIEMNSAYTLTGVIGPDDKCVSDGIKHICRDDEWSLMQVAWLDDRIVIAIDDCVVRKRLAVEYGMENLEKLIAPDAWISPTAKIGRGCIVQMGSKISRNVILGDICKVNMDVTIHHGAIIGDACTLAPGSRVLGNVTLEDGVYIGSGATILPRRIIAHGTVVGAGAVVNRNTSPGEVVAGVPARTLNT